MFDAPSTVVMLSVIVPMSSVAFSSVTVVFSTVVSVLLPQADTARAAAAMAEPVRTLEMMRIWKLPIDNGFGKWRNATAPKSARTLNGYGTCLKSRIHGRRNRVEECRAVQRQSSVKGCEINHFSQHRCAGDRKFRDSARHDTAEM